MKNNSSTNSSESSVAFATRLEIEDAEIVEAGIEETGQTPAEFVRTAVLHYIEKNPHEIVAMYPDGSLEEFWADTVEKL